MGIISLAGLLLGLNSATAGECRALVYTRDYPRGEQGTHRAQFRDGEAPVVAGDYSFHLKKNPQGTIETLTVRHANSGRRVFSEDTSVSPDPANTRWAEIEFMVGPEMISLSCRRF